jgi:hypothetical protein
VFHAGLLIGASYTKSSAAEDIEQQSSRIRSRHDIIRDMKPFFSITALLGCLFACPSTGMTAATTWSGKISDSACGAKHEAAAEGEEKMPDSDCTRTCVRGGSKYVLVADNGTIYKIANQDFAQLPQSAGRAVTLTGDVKAGTITITRIEIK